MTNYISPAESRERYAKWKTEWRPPQNVPRAMRKRAVVEFMPFQCSGSLLAKEGASTTAIMIDDSAGDVPCGTEVAIGTFKGTEFDHEGRRLTIIDVRDILLMEVAA